MHVLNNIYISRPFNQNTYFVCTYIPSGPGDPGSPSNPGTPGGPCDPIPPLSPSQLHGALLHS